MCVTTNPRHRERESVCVCVSIHSAKGEDGIWNGLVCSMVTFNYG
jgi:hypothetical protein